MSGGEVVDCGHHTHVIYGCMRTDADANMCGYRCCPDCLRQPHNCAGDRREKEGRRDG